jgi:lipoic acid synthetase
VDILTLGQYLQPSRKHLPISRYYTLEEFKELRQYGREIGFKWVEASPLVRSSYHATEQVRALSIVHDKLYGEAGLGGRFIGEQQPADHLVQGGGV